MELNYLKEFCAVADSSSFSEAAQALNVSQPLLSRHIQSLEQELDYPLFSRSTRKVSLNENGILFYPYAEQIVATLDAYKQMMSQKKETGKSQVLRIGLGDVFSGSDIHNTLSQYFKSVSIVPQYVNGTVDKLKADLLASCLDIAILYEKEDVSDIGLNRFTYSKDELSVFLPASHRLSSEPAVVPKDLCNEKLVLLRAGSGIGTFISEYYKENGLLESIYHESKFEDNILELIRKNSMVSILLAAPRVAQGIAIKKLDPTIRINLNILYAENNTSPVLEDFLNYMKNRHE